MGAARALAKKTAETIRRVRSYFHTRYSFIAGVVLYRCANGCHNGYLAKLFRAQFIGPNAGPGNQQTGSTFDGSSLVRLARRTRWPSHLKLCVELGNNINQI